MGRSRQKKKNAKKKRLTSLKDPFIILNILVRKANGYMESLNTEKDYEIPSTLVKLMRFKRWINATTAKNLWIITKTLYGFAGFTKTYFV